MVKLTPELINQSMQYTNPVRDRELDLRGYKIPVIEHLGATLDQFDTIDFSDNDLTKLDGFPLLKRLKCLLLNNNRLIRISKNLEETIPNIDSLVLTNNNIQDLSDLDPLATLINLETLSLLQNPVTTKPHYRQYVIHKIPQLKVLDFRKVKLKERQQSESLFKSKKGQDLQLEIAKRAKSKTFVPGEALQNGSSAILVGKSSGGAMTADEVKLIKEAIANAETLEEVERLNQLLKAGQLPTKPAPAKAGGGRVTRSSSSNQMDTS